MILHFTDFPRRNLIEQCHAQSLVKFKQGHKFPRFGTDIDFDGQDSFSASLLSSEIWSLLAS